MPDLSTRDLLVAASAELDQAEATLADKLRLVAEGMPGGLMGLETLCGECARTPEDARGLNDDALRLLMHAAYLTVLKMVQAELEAKVASNA